MELPGFLIGQNKLNMLHRYALHASPKFLDALFYVGEALIIIAYTYLILHLPTSCQRQIVYELGPLVMSSMS